MILDGWFGISYIGLYCHHWLWWLAPMDWHEWTDGTPQAVDFRKLLASSYIMFRFISPFLAVTFSLVSIIWYGLGWSTKSTQMINVFQYIIIYNIHKGKQPLTTHLCNSQTDDMLKFSWSKSWFPQFMCCHWQAQRNSIWRLSIVLSETAGSQLEDWGFPAINGPFEWAFSEAF